jgi:hypothetical protein
LNGLNILDWPPPLYNLQDAVLWPSRLVDQYIRFLLPKVLQQYPIHMLAGSVSLHPPGLYFRKVRIVAFRIWLDIDVINFTSAASPQRLDCVHPQVPQGPYAEMILVHNLQRPSSYHGVLLFSGYDSPLPNHAFPLPWWPLRHSHNGYLLLGYRALWVGSYDSSSMTSDLATILKLAEIKALSS